MVLAFFGNIFVKAHLTSMGKRVFVGISIIMMTSIYAVSSSHSPSLEKQISNSPRDHVREQQDTKPNTKLICQNFIKQNNFLCFFSFGFHFQKNSSHRHQKENTDLKDG